MRHDVVRRVLKVAAKEELQVPLEWIYIWVESAPRVNLSSG
jgi:hypothetical protein